MIVDHADADRSAASQVCRNARLPTNGKGRRWLRLGPCRSCFPALEGVRLIVQRLALTLVAGRRVVSGDRHAFVNHLTATAGFGGLAITGWPLSSSRTTRVRQTRSGMR